MPAARAKFFAHCISCNKHRVGKVYIEAHTPLNDHGDPSVVDKHTAVINALLKREDLVNSIRLDWEVVREVVAAEDGLPVEIAEPSAAVANSEPAPAPSF